MILLGKRAMFSDFLKCKAHINLAEGQNSIFECIYDYFSEFSEK